MDYEIELKIFKLLVLQRANLVMMESKIIKYYLISILKVINQNGYLKECDLKGQLTINRR